MHYLTIEYFLLMLSFGSILASHSNEDKRLIRSIESLSRKIINNEAAITFNEQCILNNLLPKYTNIYIYIYIYIQGAAGI